MSQVERLSSHGNLADHDGLATPDSPGNYQTVMHPYVSCLPRSDELLVAWASRAQFVLSLVDEGCTAPAQVAGCHKQSQGGRL